MSEPLIVLIKYHLAHGLPAGYHNRARACLLYEFSSGCNSNTPIVGTLARGWSVRSRLNASCTHSMIVCRLYNTHERTTSFKRNRAGSLISLIKPPKPAQLSHSLTRCKRYILLSITISDYVEPRDFSNFFFFLFPFRRRISYRTGNEAFFLFPDPLSNHTTQSPPEANLGFIF